MEKDGTLKDLLPDLERRSPAEVGVGVVLALVAADDVDATGDTSAAVDETVLAELSSSPSSVRGT